MWWKTMFVRAAIALFSAAVILVTQTSAENGENSSITYDSSYMGYIYYADPTKNESFFRAAILITPQYLVSASIDVLNETIGFPRRTLLVRVGATNIRSPSNESSDDEGTTVGQGRETEQEQEVIQISRPYSYSAEKRWLYDITVVKVLKPFVMTPFVNVTRLGTAPRLHTDKLCSVLVYLKSEDGSADRTLQRITVKVLSHSACADKVPDVFNKEHIICAIEQEHQHALSNDESFCEGNAGAPLVCEDEVVALQSTPHQKCEPPYVFQRLHIWEDFIKCSVDAKCEDKSCDNICLVTDKDKQERPETTVGPSPSTEKVEVHTEIITDAVTERVTTSSVVAKVEENTIPTVIAAPSVQYVGVNVTRRKGLNKLSNTTVLLRYRSSATLNAQVSVSLIMWNIFFKLFH